MTQFGVWVTNKNVAFQRHRFATSTEMQEGVVDAGDYKVTAHAGALSVDVAIGKAWVQIDTGTRNGLAFIYSDAAENPAHAAADATNPRIDQVVLQYNDTTIPAGVGGDVPTIRIITGTPTAGATLDNRNGAAALPNDCVRLADVLIPAAATTTSAANIRDRRPWARGAYRKIIRNNNGGNYTTASATLADVDATNLKPRIECSGAPLRFAFRGALWHSAASALYLVRLTVDDVAPDLATNTDAWADFLPVSTGNVAWREWVWDTTPAAGSHRFSFQWAVNTAGTLNLGAQNPRACELIVEELVRQDADNT